MYISKQLTKRGGTGETVDFCSDVCDGVLHCRMC